ncbi:MAG: ModD protein [Rhodomicrobium sp.]
MSGREPLPLASGLIERLLAEDVPGTDLTTEALGMGGLQGRMEFRARAAMTVAGTGIAAALISHAGAEPSVAIPQGARAKAGDLILSAWGSAAALHLSWKTAQTLTEILSGIATATRALVDAVEAVSPDVKVACSRKTVPLTRQLSTMAIRAGGAVAHRLGLSETILVFAEHRVFLPNASLKEMAARLRREAPEKKLGIEVDTVPEARAAIDAGFDIVQLEKMPLAEVSAVAEFARASAANVLIAAAGGISPANAGDYVKAGAGLIVSSWPYTAKPADVAVTIAPAGGC